MRPFNHHEQGIEAMIDWIFSSCAKRIISTVLLIITGAISAFGTSFDFSDLQWKNDLDCDNDTYFRIRTLQVTVSADNFLPGFDDEVYKVTLDKKRKGLFTSWVNEYDYEWHRFISSDWLIDFEYIPLVYEVTISSQELDEYDFRIRVFDEDENLVATFDQNDNSQLDNQKFELASTDGTCPASPDYTIFDAWWNNEIDRDDDTYTKYRRLYFDVDVNSGTHSVYVEILSSIGGGSLYKKTNTFSITDNLSSDVQYIDVGIPNEEFSHGSYDFRLNVYEPGGGIIMAQRDYSNDSHLNDQKFETSSEDGPNYTIYNAWWDDEVDWNDDGYTSYRKLYFDVNVSSGTHSVYVSVYNKLASANSGNLFKSTNTFTITSNSSSDAQYVEVGIPNTELSHDLYDFWIYVYESGNEETQDLLRWDEDSDLNNQKFETFSEDQSSDYFDITPNSINVNASSGSTSFNVSTNVGWSVSHDASWLTASKTNGSTISIDYDANTSSNPRTATITGSTGDLNETVTVIQSGSTSDQNHSPETPILMSPEYESIVTVPFTMTWECSDPDDDELLYNIYVKETGTTNWVVWVSEITNNYFDVTDNIDLDYITYDWVVSATDGEFEEESQFGKFRIHPGAFSNLNPSNGAENISLNPTLSWNYSNHSATIEYSVYRYYGNGSEPDAVRLVAKTNKTSLNLQSETDFGSLEYDTSYGWQITTSDQGAYIISEECFFSTLPKPLELSISPSSQYVSSESGITTFDIESNTTWEVTIDNDETDWLTVSPASGSNNEIITVTYTENNSQNSRSALITVSGEGASSRSSYLNQDRCIEPSRPNDIFGEINPFENDTYVYTVSPILADHQYEWFVSDGNDITSNNTTASITWETIGRQTISVKAIDECGKSSPFVLYVNVSSEPLSVNYQANQKLPLIYPIPVDHILYIDNLPTGTNVSVFSISGKLIRSIQEQNASSLEMNVSDLESGIYLIELTNREKITVKKIIIK